ncbi:hypothetical protein ACFQGW_20945 [Xanthomonas theicola]|uniref:hypothetical protein n=1 Tax=Xanthomonas theicola TaxID=56464 RepID=UPI003615A147
MSYSDFLVELQKIGLSVRAFAGLVGMNPNSLSNYARLGELPTHIALIAVLVVGLAERGGDYRQIMSKVAITPKRPRGNGKSGRFGEIHSSQWIFDTHEAPLPENLSDPPEGAP